MSEIQKTVLHADDERSACDYVRALLSDRYRVESVGDFDSALARVARGGVDLLILDNLMPGEYPLADAAAVCERLRKTHPKLPVIVYTSSLDGSPTFPQELERMVQAPVVCKEDANPNDDPLRRKVDELLG